MRHDVLPFRRANGPRPNAEVRDVCERDFKLKARDAHGGDTWAGAIPASIVRVVRGPRENGYRPAIDPLFRSAAKSFGPRVTGVVLSGVLDDGTAGLAVIKDVGGRTLVQDPEEALYPMMPTSAIDFVSPDRVLEAHGLGSAVVEFTALTSASPTGHGLVTVRANRADALRPREAHSGVRLALPLAPMRGLRSRRS